MLITALIMGFAGSLHCIGMCSPLVMAMTSMKRGALINKLIYNSGRILTYGFFGALVSSVGAILPLSKYQNLVSIVLGVILLIIGLTGFNRVNIAFITPWLQKLSIFLKNQFGKFYRQRNYFSTMVLGMLNGILPCGLSFIALTFCLTLSEPVEGFGFMLVFGVGTLPAMVGLPSLINVVVNKLNWQIRRITTTLLIVSGSLLVVRVFLTALTHAHSIQEGVDIVLCR